MKSFVAFVALVAVVAADVSHIVPKDESNAEIIEQNADVHPEGFIYKYKTSNGIEGEAQGALKVLGKDEAAVAVQGSNAYTSPEGLLIQISYVADENGYRAVGAHLPTPPAPQPIPDYILRSIAFNEANAPKSGTGKF